VWLFLKAKYIKNTLSNFFEYSPDFVFKSIIIEKKGAADSAGCAYVAG